MALRARFAAIRRIRPGRFAPWGGHRGRVQPSPRPVDLVRFPQPVQQHLVEALPDPGLLPGPESSPAGHPTPTAHLLGEHLPGDARHQDKQDPRQHLPVRDGRPPAFGSGLGRREKRLDHGPQFIGDDLLSHFAFTSSASSIYHRGGVLLGVLRLG